MILLPPKPRTYHWPVGLAWLELMFTEMRTKRCACSSLLDSECHYFCHLDIIWINTPSKTTVYGLGSILARRRRSTGRCTCAKADDQSCTNFCQHSFSQEAQDSSGFSEGDHSLNNAGVEATRVREREREQRRGGRERAAERCVRCRKAEAPQRCLFVPGWKTQQAHHGDQMVAQH
uniref:Endothelin-like toxin domain-containing protein n=1 Tax=Seriola dumerili TaxID=41447 RepID=A0A3B4UHK8_SERDU